jgi:hypothetical protein
VRKVVAGVDRTVAARGEKPRFDVLFFDNKVPCVFEFWFIYACVQGGF